MPRAYTVKTSGVAVSAAQDLMQIKGAAGKMVEVTGVWWKCTDTTLAAAQMLQTRCRYLPVTVTDGSGGSTPTVDKVDPGDSAASLTALANNTTKATTNGTAINQDESGDHLYAGYDQTFARPVPVGPSESFVFELLSTVSGTVHLTSGVRVREYGG